MRKRLHGVLALAEYPVGAVDQPIGVGHQPRLVATGKIMLGKTPKNPSMMLVIALAHFKTARPIKNTIVIGKIAVKSLGALIFEPDVQSAASLIMESPLVQILNDHARFIAAIEIV